MSARTGLSVRQVTDEVLYAGLIEMQEMPELAEGGGGWGSAYSHLSNELAPHIDTESSSAHLLL